MGLLQAKAWIEGTRPLLWHRFTPESLVSDAGARVERQGGKGNDPSEWRRGVLATARGQLYLEPSYVFGCLRDAGRYTAATLQVLTEKILVDRFLPKEDSLATDPTAAVYLDVRMVRNPATGGRNVRYRVAAKAGWRAEFEIAWEGSRVTGSVTLPEYFAELMVCGDYILVWRWQSAWLVGTKRGRVVWAATAERRITSAINERDGFGLLAGQLASFRAPLTAESVPRVGRADNPRRKEA